jgi:2-polyprenyl-6-hydroxyphenyl methylase/3-demethylubiquinone-9 3-methyltransferase
VSENHSTEVKHRKRFGFGANWMRFIKSLNDYRIKQAEQSLQAMLNVTNLKGKIFLDIGSGSGLFSLAARRLGAKVHSFDYDPQSVACTRELRQRFFPSDSQWIVEEGSVLDWDYLSRLGRFDVVYSWGVLHHTGAMWQALDNVGHLVRPGGYLFIAIYNDQGLFSRYWKFVKRMYVGNVLLKLPLLILLTPYLFVIRWFARLLTNRLALDRGMSLWYDMIDWIGGYPFEVATPESIFQFFRDRGFLLEKLKTCGGRHGCNEFVFTREK